MPAPLLETANLLAAAMTPENVLAKELASALGRPAAVKSVQRRRMDASTHGIERWQVTLDDGEPVRLLFKDLQPDIAREPDVLPERNPREALIYQRLLAGRRFGAPAVYASVYDEARQRYWLFLEDLGADTLEHGSMEAWLAAARLLAEVAGVYANRDAELRELRCLGEHDADFYRRHVATARLALSCAGREALLARFDALAQPFAGIANWLVRQPRTLVHGDVFPSNVILQAGPRVRLIDWEWAAIGTAGWDIARLLCGWETHRSRLLAAYSDQFERHSGGPLDATALANTVACCGAVHAVRFVSLAADEGAAGVPEALDAVERALREASEAIGDV
ncbi:MAG TPA: phosphotransferase [Chthonomonadaceae bacterium]|nr:phosphotransferase [Chthonomonadaceae bacterium]